MAGSAATGEARIHLVEDDAGKTMTLGDTQAAWCVDQGYTESTGYEKTGPANAICRYKVIKAGLTIEGLNEAVIAEPSNRECDFCRVIPCHWQVNHRPFELKMAPGGPLVRPIFVCDTCVNHVRSNDKDMLIDRMFDSTMERAFAEGGAAAADVAQLDPALARRELAPMLRRFVSDVFANRRGYPVHVDDVEAV